MSYTIVAMDQHRGIGLRGDIPWKNTENGREDLKYFKTLTINQAVIMGWATYVSIGRLLPSRLNIIVTRNHVSEAPPNEEGVCAVFTDLDSAVAFGRKFELLTGKRCFVIGGGEIFQEYFRRYNPIDEHVTVIPGNYHCDTFYPNEKAVCVQSTVLTFYNFLHPCVYEEENYLRLFKQVLTQGNSKSDRTGTGTISLFSPPELRFSLQNNDLPVLTTKTVAIKSGVIPELMWFISGSTDTRKLEAKGCNIWKGNTSRAFLDARGLSSYAEKDMGPGYGFQWRHSGAPYRGMDADYTGQGVDQLQGIVDLLRVDPDSRRMIMCAWAPADLQKMALPPCHIMYQVYTHVGEDGRRHLSAKMYQRSADSFLGVPFNITSYAILTHILAELAGCVAHELILTFGDYHIYRNHTSQINQQLERTPRAFPKIFFKRSLTHCEIDDVSEHDFDIVGYSPHGHIAAPMAI